MNLKKYKGLWCKTIRRLYDDNENTNADFVAKSLFECFDIIKNNK